MNNKHDCNCCGTVRKHRTASWGKCLGFKRPSCPTISIPKNNVLSQTPSHESKYVRNAKLLRHSTISNNSSTRWKRVNWKKFQLIRQTKEFQTRTINNTTNNNYGLVLRNGRVINVKPTSENPCGTYTTELSKVNMPATKISNCCTKSNLTVNQINAMDINQVNSNLGIDSHTEQTC